MEPKAKIFKTPGGVYYLKQLFYELATDTDRPHVLYTLKDFDHQGYPSLRRLFLELGDETEYIFAETYFDSWPHYKRLLETAWFNDYMSGYREELRLQNLSASLLQIKRLAKEGNLQANKYLLSEEWKGSKKSSNVGRPTKAKIKEEADNLFRAQSSVNEDFDRIQRELLSA